MPDPHFSGPFWDHRDSSLGPVHQEPFFECSEDYMDPLPLADKGNKGQNKITLIA